MDDPFIEHFYWKRQYFWLFSRHLFAFQLKCSIFVMLTCCVVAQCNKVYATKTMHLHRKPCSEFISIKILFIYTKLQFYIYVNWTCTPQSGGKVVVVELFWKVERWFLLLYSMLNQKQPQIHKHGILAKSINQKPFISTIFQSISLINILNAQHVLNVYDVYMHINIMSLSLYFIIWN